MPYQSNMDDNVSPTKMLKDSQAELREAIDEILAPITIKTTWSKPRPFTEDRQIRKVTGKKKAAEKLVALFQAREQEILTELLGEQQLIIEHGADYEDKKQYWAVPVAVIERLQDKANES